MKARSASTVAGSCARIWSSAFSPDSTGHGCPVPWLLGAHGWPLTWQSPNTETSQSP